MQLKFGFKKEWLHFLRSFRFGGMLICIFSFAIVNPLLYKALAALSELVESDAGLTQQIAAAGIDLTAFAEDADIVGTVFCGTLLEFCATSLLVVMILLMSPFGGEQKKRATLIPFCSGLEYKNYLIPKFVLYPCVTLAATFLGGCFGGAVCNAMYDQGDIGIGAILLGSLMAAVYAALMVTIYMALGLCTGRPGIMVIVMYLGQTLVQQILLHMGLISYNPFTLFFFISAGALTNDEYIKGELTSIIVAMILSVIISALMYFMTLSVLKSKRINNQENKPEF